LHAVLEGWVVAEISDVTKARAWPEAMDQSRRGHGIQSVRPSHVPVSDRFRSDR
jgi:hypothetical protein